LAVLLALVCGLVCGSAGRAQSSGGSNGGQGQGQGTMRPYSPHQDIDSLPFDDGDPVMAERRILALNIQRQKQMVADTDKLLKLARELNDEVAAQNTGTFTPDELHKIAEIEKLARNVRERMTEGAGQPASTMPPPAPPPLFFPNH
jgi:hypothetical protein